MGGNREDNATGNEGKRLREENSCGEARPGEVETGKVMR